MRLNEGPPPSLPYPSRLFHPPRHFSARESRGETFYDYLRLLDHPHAANNRTSRVSKIKYIVIPVFIGSLENFMPRRMIIKFVSISRKVTLNILCSMIRRLISDPNCAFSLWIRFNLWKRGWIYMGKLIERG